MIAANQHMLGIRPTWDGLCIDPCLPDDWEEVRVTRRFRGTEYRIIIRKQKGPHGRTQELVVDGDRINGTIIPPVAGRAIGNGRALWLECLHPGISQMGDKEGFDSLLENPYFLKFNPHSGSTSSIPTPNSQARNRRFSQPSPIPHSQIQNSKSLSPSPIPKTS